MEHRAFGRSGVDVPVIGMGTWQTFDVHNQRDRDNSRAVVDTAIAAGTTLFDTSPMYGESERVLADAVDGRREQVLIADKIWTSSRNEAREQIDRAFAWYGGTIDICQVHNLLAWEKHLPLLDELRAEGRVRVIGATHYKAGAFKELMSLMRSGRIQMVQVPYNTGDRSIEKNILPLADDLGLGVMIMKPFGSGSIVARQPTDGELEPLREFGIQTWAQALLKWVLSERRVHCAIPATSRPEHAAENAAAGRPPWLDDETRRYIGKLAAKHM